MSELTVQCAIDVTTLLNAAPAGTFTPPFTAVRKYAPFNTLEQLATLTISVVGKSRDQIFANRAGSMANTTEVDIGIQKLLGKPDDLAEMDALMLLVDQISKFLISVRKLPCNASLMKIGSRPIYDPEMLLTKQCFTSVVTATYELTGAA